MISFQITVCNTLVAQSQVDPHLAITWEVSLHITFMIAASGESTPMSQTSYVQNRNDIHTRGIVIVQQIL